MFTGLVEEVGQIVRFSKGANSTILTIQANKVLDSTTMVGDSIAVNGVCLTVTTIENNHFTADIMNETLKRSGLGTLKAGDPVNLERAMAANGRFGGHIVSGHIDGVGTITKITEDDNAVWYSIQTESSILRYIVEKGSIAIDGISLTVAGLSDTTFQVSTIPHTRKMTNLSSKAVGSAVNLECDIVGKYVERLMQTSEKTDHTKSNIDMNFLAENGFL